MHLYGVCVCNDDPMYEDIEEGNDFRTPVSGVCQPAVQCHELEYFDMWTQTCVEIPQCDVLR